MNILRAFIAGTVVPTIVLPIILLAAIYNGKSELLNQPIIHFIPVIWGIWNVLYIAFLRNRFPGPSLFKYLIAGALLGFILAFYGVFITDIPKTIGLEEYRYYPLIAAPVGYAIIWAFIVKFLNYFLRVQE